eukprot:6193761-Pleurochrysis_carterae.AAC.3
MRIRGSVRSASWRQLRLRRVVRRAACWFRRAGGSLILLQPRCSLGMRRRDTGDDAVPVPEQWVLWSSCWHRRSRQRSCRVRWCVVKEELCEKAVIGGNAGVEGVRTTRGGILIHLRGLRLADKGVHGAGKGGAVASRALDRCLLSKPLGPFFALVCSLGQEPLISPRRKRRRGQRRAHALHHGGAQPLGPLQDALRLCEQWLRLRCPSRLAFTNLACTLRLARALPALPRLRAVLRPGAAVATSQTRRLRGRHKGSPLSLCARSRGRSCALGLQIDNGALGRPPRLEGAATPSRRVVANVLLWPLVILPRRAVGPTAAARFRCTRCAGSGRRRSRRKRKGVSILCVLVCMVEAVAWAVCCVEERLPEDGERRVEERALLVEQKGRRHRWRCLRRKRMCKRVHFRTRSTGRVPSSRCIRHACAKEVTSVRVDVLAIVKGDRHDRVKASTLFRRFVVNRKDALEGGFE